MAVVVVVRGITATLEGGRVSVRGAGEARDFEAVARRLWAAAARETLRRAGLTREPVPCGWRAEEYVRRRARIVACGQSRDGVLRVARAGAWTVTGEITPRRVEEAAAALVHDYRRQIRALKRAIWPSGPEPGGAAGSDRGRGLQW